MLFCSYIVEGKFYEENEEEDKEKRRAVNIKERKVL